MEMQSRKYVVEVLTEDDLIWFVEVAAVRMLTEELKRPELIDLKNLYGLALLTIEQGTSFIVKKDGECIGALGSLPFPNLYNPAITTMVELFWYVLPEHRESRAGYMLFKAFDDKAKEIADESTLSLLNSSTIGIKSLEKRGFALGEFAFRKEYRRE